MYEEQRETLLEFLHVVLSILMKIGPTNKQAELLETWQQMYDAMVRDK